MENNKLQCSNCKEQRDVSNFAKAKTTRGFQYICKVCTSHTTTPFVAKSNKSSNDNKYVSSHKGSIVMNALMNCPNYDVFLKIIDDVKDNFEYDSIFKLVSKKYPDKYYDVYLKLKHSVVLEGNDEAKDTLEEVNENEHDKFNVTQSYINQYQHDPSMIQVGEDIESDDEHNIMTVRSGDKYCKIRVKKSS